MKIRQTFGRRQTDIRMDMATKLGVPFILRQYVCIVVVVLCVLLWLSCVYYCSCLVYIVVVVLCILFSSYVYLLYYVCIAVFTLDAGLLARSQYPEGPATGHLDTGFSWFPCIC